MKRFCIECKKCDHGSVDFYNFKQFYCYKCWIEIDRKFKSEYTEELKIRLDIHYNLSNILDQLRNFRDIFRLCSLNFDYFCYHTKLINTTRGKIKYALERLDEFKDLIDDYEYKDICYWLNLLNKQTSED